MNKDSQIEEKIKQFFDFHQLLDECTIKESHVQQLSTLLNTEIEGYKNVYNAWNIQGPVPSLHRSAQQKLRQTWPTLANALDSLSKKQDLEGGEK